MKLVNVLLWLALFMLLSSVSIKERCCPKHIDDRNTHYMMSDRYKYYPLKNVKYPRCAYQNMQFPKYPLHTYWK
jgi:hypothetical protein